MTTKAQREAIQTLMLEGYGVLSGADLLSIIRMSLLNFQGHVITPELAEERARNLAIILANSVVTL